MTERQKLLEEVIEQVKLSYPWMLKDIKIRADQLSNGGYTDMLLHAIMVGELLEKV